ncbi:DUF1788 domain-containing protein [Patescibacteria group bacterium]|nr:DUF1788 domain-containing protein [Patescibacteria group bacterium]
MDTFKSRLNKIFDRITSDELLQNKGLSKEIGFYIFDYPPEKELVIRDHIEFILNQLKKKKPNLRVIQINLFQLIVDYLKNRKLLDRVLQIQQTNGDQALLKALKGPLDAKKFAKVFVEEADPKNHDLVILSGVGNAWPLLRSHNLLNNLHSLMEGTPLVMFYPGVYTGQDLQLFGRQKEKNYYRAFQLIK